MHELGERFAGAEQVPVPDQWDEIQIRSRSLPPPPPGWRLAISLAALVITVVSIGIVALAFRGVHGQGPTAELRANGEIVFVAPGPQPSSIPFQNLDLIAFDPASGARVNLTDTPTEAETSPVWSPDGTAMVFERTSATGDGADLKIADDLVVADADLSNQRVILLCSDTCPTDIAWSPDGSALAWTTEQRVGGGYVTALQTYDLSSGATETLCDSRTCGYPGQLAWSPDGTRVAFSDAGVNRLPGLLIPSGPIWIAEPASGSVSAITTRSGPCAPGSNDTCTFDSSPEWSPDGRQIAFVQTTNGAQQGATTEVMLANADGSDQRVLYGCASSDQCRQGPIAWSPDGSQIAFIDRYDHPTLHLVSPGGADTPIPLPASVGEDPGPLVWSPDGTELAFLGGGRLSDLFAVDVAAREVRDVASGLTSEGELAWLPAGAIDLSTAPTPEPTSPTAPPPTPVSTGTIVFSSSDGSNQEDEGAEIWAVGTDGSGLTRLTDNQYIDANPALSPDGTRIAFESDRPGDRNTQIYVMASDGSEPHVLTDQRTGAVQPSWSPDGTQIAFVSSAGYGEPGGIFVMNADGSNQRLVAPGNAFDPSWSPDGDRIVYALASADGQIHLQVAELTNSAANTQLPALPADQQEPAWSPDGQTIAFQWTSSGGEGIYTIRLDGSGLHKLADGSSPTWSPDGSWLAYNHTDEKTGPQIWLVAADGTGDHPLTSMPGFLKGSPIYAITDEPSWGSAN